MQEALTAGDMNTSSNHWNSPGGSGCVNGWVKGVVAHIVSENTPSAKNGVSSRSPKGVSNTKLDPRLGAVWVLKVTLSPWDDAIGEQNRDSTGAVLPMGEVFSGGDLVVLHCGETNRWVQQMHVNLALLLCVHKFFV